MGLRIMTVAPEIPGGLELIAWLRDRGVAVSLGHSAATVEQARAGYAAGGRTTTHLFNGMSGVDHRPPGLAVAALTDDAAYVELIADGQHVHPAVWDLIARAKPADRLVLISDALPTVRHGHRPGHALRHGHRDPRGPMHARRHRHARGLGHRPGHCGPERGRGTGSTCRSRLRRRAATPLALLGVTDRRRPGSRACSRTSAGPRHARASGVARRSCAGGAPAHVPSGADDAPVALRGAGTHTARGGHAAGIAGDVVEHPLVAVEQLRAPGSA